MNTYLKDNEVRTIKNIEELRTFLEERTETDIWTTPYINELSIGGIPLNAPILISSVRSTYPRLVAKDEEIEECMNTEIGNMGLLMSYPSPIGDGLITVPLRYTAMTSLFERAGIGGRTIRATEEKRNAKVLSTDRKASILSEMLALYSDECKVLYRDGKVSTVRSKQYKVLDASKLLSSLEEEISNEWTGYHMVEAKITHEKTLVYIIVDDVHAEKKLKETLERTSIPTENVKLGFLFVTSDVGNSSAMVYPLLTANGTMFPIGEPLGMAHSTGSSMEKWIKEILPRLAFIARETTSKLESLANIEIKHIGGCLRHVACNIGLPKDASFKVAEDMENMYFSCTAFDIFYTLFDILAENEKKYPRGYTPSQRLRYEDMVISSLMLDFASMDEEFNWKV